MKPTDFAYSLTAYLSKHLPGQVGASSNTIQSYRDTFSLLIKYCFAEKHIPAEKLILGQLDKKMIESFLSWIEVKRKCSVSTRNQRLAAIHAFFKHLQSEKPHAIYQYQQILAIPIKKSEKKPIFYLTLDAIKKLLDMPDRKTIKGRRDLVMLSLLYDSGSRVQEIADLKVANIRLNHPATLKITGKGNKTRIVPLMEPMAKLVEQYLKENKLNLPQWNESPLFRNRGDNKLTRSGITYILQKYFNDAKRMFPNCFPNTVSPHVMRHSKAMHLLQSGVNLIYIRDLLGHTSIQTTEIYARTDSRMKRKALENAYPNIVADKLPEWQQNTGLLEWLQNLGT
ncbi:MAG: integrase [Candidatus Raymondbacteria bacterium RifOxyA12_full_50_37]|uniref:Integrase n=1 Tax=Candidatus Raymondbacteria bacterium RIFOXYD12_FULL_49_13 TaxID=1817890 RepID=A0A1F7FDG5_UNCRA|nr:MAG: integrase [Candidatus Raymondbacteria bacterium RIFOXYA2_FULL_49_16]OGJ88151.1 MAG: integrase [Candidatus Raymondbacteria bacterium RifOxyA12_full_50_37]OGJ93638.1 MAG: integrase [Candidatus Raymondbacteria bacterium RifOxyB12_full_50_8]OGJ96953.1 MAG: integrase [Candidatus Raymondbacteria bacterium RIFOXYC2_FULL_50_21]OGK04678.1 MAG: integrase [Candidatus Raymondbacteria bacterium RIFOXYD12_FULL_49_13]OGK06217.1 MAG: integrase [Candidatus Raymondbacteria bacterium RifOxyC12_full_50_8]